jgi:hypothetical protein
LSHRDISGSQIGVLVQHLFTWLWLAWISAFFVIEGIALKLGDKSTTFRTLSANLRHWFHTDTVVGRSTWAVIGGVFFGWFIIHIATAPGSLF